jgi:serine/threonine-protein kinase
VKLADMGIARLQSPEALTATLSVRGTAAYISPEQVRGDPVDARADLYSLGCVLFEMLTGRTPFEGDLAALSYAHTHTPAPRLRSINPAVPLAMDELVAAMLEKDPSKRPQTAEEVERSLASAMRHDAVEPTALIEPVELPPSPTQRLPAGGRPKPGPKTRPMVVIAVGGLAALLFIALLASREPDGRTDASQRPPQISSSPTTHQPSPVETSSPATQQPSPVATISPPPDQSSPQEAAAIVLGIVDEGLEAGEITDHFDHDIRHAMDEILRETDKGDEDTDRLLEKIEELRNKVSEALEKGEITSADRASAIDEALVTLEEAVRDAQV